MAWRLGCTWIVTGSGTGLPYLKRAVQHGVVVEALKAGADVAAEYGVTIVLEYVLTTESLASLRKIAEIAAQL